jgi:hypothetical protein
MFGLPGGSTPEGPATTAGCLLVWLMAALVTSALVAALFYATSFITL